YVEEPSTLVGDIVLLFPELSEMRLPGNKAYKPSEVAATSKAIAPDPAYTAALDKANAEFQANAEGYHDKLTKAFDEAKDEHRAALAKYGQETAAHAAKADETRAEWIKEWSDYRKAEAESRDQANRVKTLAQGSKDAIKSTFENLKETYRKGRAALDARWGEWNKLIAGIERDPKTVYDSIEDAKNTRLRGSPQSLIEFNNLLSELGIQEFEDTPEGRKAIVGQRPVPIETLRTHYSAIVRRIMRGKLPGNIYHALEDVRDVIDKQIVDGLKSRNLPESVYQNLKSSEHMFLSDWDDSK